MENCETPPEDPQQEIRLPVDPLDYDPRIEKPGAEERSPGVRIIDLVGDDEDDAYKRPRRPPSYIINL